MSLPEVLSGIRAAEAQAGRAPGSARLVAVTKGQTLEAIDRCVLSHGTFPLGEGRAQELRDKAAARPDLEWHYLGALQRNKVKYLRPAALVHSLEAVWQAQAIAQAAQGWGRAPAVLLQVHNGEAQKHGIEVELLPGVLREVQATGLSVRGLMVMAPDLDGHPARDERLLALFQDTARRAHDLGLSELSMGMSGDYPLAVHAGATLVRVGRSLFS
ncbi:YggS family pyridoxal phosphate enzyme [Deinococcus multiflagellatus]|uniref:YggS family pyridoxal phosphate enzyme n=1 Tax=Deinococcus multiflagellatus TaxID=1656887 RepID=A0ABW1ZHN5_9DEIO|nr:alanine racemase [Deinococcus multiflagellatus]MBZ9714315.1 alanine racemase [Deinococcus multiflagellatus]